MKISVCQLVALMFCCFHGACAQSAAQQKWAQIESSFVSDWQKLQIASWPLDYKEFFRALPTQAAARKKDSVLGHYVDLMDKIQGSELSNAQQLHYEHLQYMLRFQRDVLELAIGFCRAGGDKSISQSESIFQLPDAARWYEMFVRKYTSVNISPDSIFTYGLRETERLNKISQKLRAKIAVRHDWISDTALIHSTYRIVAAQARKNLAAYFPLEILSSYSLFPRPIMPSTQATPPGYYSGLNASGSAFLFYNFNNGRHDVADAGWLYLHEAVPGHHLQMASWFSNADKPFFYDLIQYEYNGLFEGWACYTESYGYASGIYDDPKMEYAYLQWNLVRSMRLCIDVGINYYGWSNDRAAAFWNTFLKDDPDLMAREITRCARWPAQALSYNIGAAAILSLRDIYLANNKHSEKDFHRRVLTMGMVPVELLLKAMIGG